MSKTKTDIPKGWRALKHGEVIQPHDRLWSWNTGPWKLAGSSDSPTSGQIYSTHTDAENLIDWTHWLHIRRIASKKKK